MNRLLVDGVVVRFGAVTVLDGVDLAVESGEVVALLGASGSGKSTLLRVVAGLLAPDAGRILIDGDDVARVPTHRRGVGMVFQDEQLFPHLDVRSNIGFGLRMARRPATEIASRTAAMLDLVGLTPLADRAVTDLSGGEAKRVALARALAPAPRVLLLDEPLTGLDADLHDRLAADLRGLLRTSGTTAVHVTHDRREAEVVADRIVTMDSLR